MARRLLLHLTAVLGFTVLLASCGQPGAPQPPSLELARAVDDLTAIRKADRVTLRWTPPNRFTDGRIIRRIGPTRICRTLGQSPAATCTVVGTLPAAPDTPKGKPLARTAQEYTDVVPPSLVQQSPVGTVMYGIEVLNRHGRSVGLSNQIAISTAPALNAPAQLTAQVGENGITLAWQPVSAPGISGVSFAYQIYRRGETGDFAVIGSVPIDQSKYLDQTFEWQKKFDYRVVVITESARDKRILVEGADSEAVNVFARDVFPPAQPHEVQAVFSGPGQQKFIDVSWAPNLEPDLAGYNVYRSEEGASAVKLNAQLITSPSFRDEHVELGKTYVYSVSAVDLRNNESTKSADTSERVPN
jgi:hypothetical protein